MDKIEKIARAICEGDNCNPDAQGYGMGVLMAVGTKYKLWEARIKQAEAVLKALTTLCLIFLFFTSCATIISGTKQIIEITSEPTGANCLLIRKGKTIAEITTPKNIIIDKNKYPINITCNKFSYKTASLINESGIDPWTYANAPLLFVSGWGIDSAIGADNKYISPVNIKLSK